ncbi:uracil-DNA glycosylase [Carnobacterium antarcticum]|uniref:Uracil-DNA glycosylase n=1 Tax=Carnobacterium antarcticum TaxID=2126436 RepID=A0ABW4NPG6_9LACT|nr:uracil-DNA glycosylase [Carnobacterium sp. CP1]ALV21923.1 Uracil-DNA glycosylase, family 1 [Carnobacterium sp. CP1]
MTIPIKNDWAPILNQASLTPTYQKLRQFLAKEYQEETVYPAMDQIWEAFEWTPYHEVKVVILGQDPYHGPHQAHGLSFSVQPTVKVPPSLLNIYKELENDLGYPPVKHGYLKSWADQGVLLLNTVLTVRKGEAHSHRNKGWEQVTDMVIQKLSERETPMVFILWGSPSIKKRALIDEQKHTVITSPHPSPLSAYRGFFGSKPFSKANAALIQMGQEPINWQLPEEV